MNLWLKLDETNRKNLGISLRENFQIVKKISLIVWILNLHKNPYSKIEKKKKWKLTTIKSSSYEFGDWKLTELVKNKTIVIKK